MNQFTLNQENIILLYIILLIILIIVTCVSAYFVMKTINKKKAILSELDDLIDIIESKETLETIALTSTGNLETDDYLLKLYQTQIKLNFKIYIVEVLNENKYFIDYTFLLYTLCRLISRKR